MNAPRALRPLALRPFQQRASDAIADIVLDTAEKMGQSPSQRAGIALAQGVTLLRAPTGSGKTITIGRTIERLVGATPRRTVWFWFAPFSGLVTQTRDVLAAECPGIRLRDLGLDRLPDDADDGDCFVATWASVAAEDEEARRARQDTETMPGIDTMVAALRASGWFVGVVIDEAHVNFGAAAKQAARFYLDTLQPDFTVLATATPKDEQLTRFAETAGIEHINRIEISRDEVVRAGLNKVGVRCVHFRAEERDERVLDMEEVAIYAALQHHERLKQALVDAGIPLVPLMMIQVENVSRKELAASGGLDPADRAKQILRNLGVAADRIAIHTSGQPDPYFHTLAYDETKEFLIFKMAAATGFDAPRAWTLVSLRKAVGPEFGLQVLGRIMRVHSRLQPLHPFQSHPPRLAGLLDYGYVFLANPGQQFSLVEAARQLKEVRDGIETVTDNIVVLDVGGEHAMILDPTRGFLELLDQPAQITDAQETPSAAASEGMAPRERAYALRIQPQLTFALDPDGLASFEAEEEEVGTLAPARAVRRPESWVAYPLRDDLDYPRALAREIMPPSMEGLTEAIVQRITFDEAAIALVNRTRGRVIVTEEEVFAGVREAIRHESVPISALRVAQQAQFAFRFNDSIDERDLKRELVIKLRQTMLERGYDPPSEHEIRRGLDLLALARPNLIRDACRDCLAQHVRIEQDEPIPATYYGPPGLERAARALHGVFPHDMNGEEMAMARLLDGDTSGTVRWWLRNVENTRWAVSLILPTGRRHYPDFVVGVDPRRRSEDHVGLVEVKDDGFDGRLFSRVNAEKVRGSHSRYGRVLMVFRDGETKDWWNTVYRPDLQMIAPGTRFTLQDLVYI